MADDVVRIAEDNSPSGAGFYLADARGYFRQQGLTVKFVTFPSGVDMLPALAAGEVDVAGGITDAGLFRAVQQGLDVKIIGDKGRDIPGRPHFALVLRTGLARRIQHYRDLKGLKVAMASTRSLNEEMLDKALALGGLSLRDVEVVVIDSFPEIRAALARRRVDAALQIEPFLTLGREQRVAKVFRDPAEYAPGEQLSVLLADAPFVTERRATAVRFMVAYRQGVRDYNREFRGRANLYNVSAVLARYTGMGDFRLWARTAPVALDPNALVSPRGIAQDLAWHRRMGYVYGPVDLGQLIDLSIAREAARVISAGGR